MCTSDLNGCTQTVRPPEQIISDIIWKEAGVSINPQVIRLVVKYNWRELSAAAHKIHEAG
ncbi:MULTISPECIES: hypothetical protein [unclassified Bradyrhizobium]|uniref:hypothetical protein n=1 Tax=unclassified Bradyrhizobium TaxID=2631580 RepID=UPI00291606E4|nr:MULTISPECIES: hypothetical protein [unclassified Bradyrhizobium]